jgi:hypothetical protein
MSTNLQDITLESMDGVLVATNDAGHLVYPMLHLDRQPTPADAQGWDRVLIFVDGNGGIDVTPTIIRLNEENNYFQSLYFQGEGAWAVSGVVEEFIRLESSSGQMSGIGHARIDVTKAPGLTIRGGYSCFFIVTVANADGTKITIPVSIDVNIPLEVDHDGDKKHDGETFTVNLNTGNGYSELLTIIRDREWTLENVDTNVISVSPASGNGAALPDFTDTLTSTKSPNLSATTAKTTFQIVSLHQRVNVVVNITITLTGEWVDPIPGEEGVTGTENMYLYL